ncbi:MAG: hypothetical protein HYR80_02140 [Nitrospirae bacterium]|nr:hypothetical protein [Nitrospirota bacterium]
MLAFLIGPWKLTFGQSAIVLMSSGIGAILGAPFMLSTLTLPLVGFGVYFFSKRKKRSRQIHLNFQEIGVDLKYFLISFTFAIAASLIENRLTHIVIALFLIGLYLYYLKIVFQRPSADHLDLEPLYFRRKAKHPGILIVGFQTVTGLGLIIAGAYSFIDGIKAIALIFHLSPMILSLLVTPIATELPEKLNSLIWISKKKDHLAFSNVTGAMVFQSTFPVSIGLFGTPWRFDQSGTVNIILTLVTSLFYFMILLFKNEWKSFQLVAGSLAYFGYLLYLLVQQ